ncbi:MAG: low molecular weight phosphotyrosine protein phosphatase [Myxococcales bacterium]|nr:low molecular weight phosphotyrosine protein phosphatase [Myxococcales bacterium]
MPPPPVRLCFVCLGNICRSPQAEGIFRHLVEREGLAGSFEADSAGTGAWHAGEPPDRRTQATSRRRGVPLSGTARQVEPADFDRFDLLLAIDSGIADQLRRLAPTPAHRTKVHLLRAYDSAPDAELAVPDPYYGGATGFDEVFDICWRSCEGLLAQLRQAPG